jgi:starch phosphorylase
MVNLGCSFQMENGVIRAVAGHPSHLLGVPYDRPVVGYGGRTINTLRLLIRPSSVGTNPGA